MKVECSECYYEHDCNFANPNIKFTGCVLFQQKNIDPNDGKGDYLRDQKQNR